MADGGNAMLAKRVWKFTPRRTMSLRKPWKSMDKSGNAPARSGIVRHAGGIG